VSFQNIGEDSDSSLFDCSLKLQGTIIAHTFHMFSSSIKIWQIDSLFMFSTSVIILIIKWQSPSTKLRIFFFLYAFVGCSDLDQPDLGACYTSSSAVQKSFLPLKYLSMERCLISIKMSQCTLCFVCSFVGLICIALNLCHTFSAVRTQASVTQTPFVQFEHQNQRELCHAYALSLCVCVCVWIHLALVKFTC
jgi:hypothetical protein